MNPKILVVDDDEMALAMVEHTLHGAGYSAVIATSGEDAMKHIRDGGCQLVITDWEMPGMGGLELCRAVRREHIPSYVYIVLLTAHNTVSERVQGLSAGADDFMSKPFDSDELIARVRSGERVLSLDTRDLTIFTVARLVESRDPETGAHLERVQAYCRVIAQQLATTERYREKIDAQFIRLLVRTSPLHDIGKVGVPDRILLKPDKLSADEFAAMKEHVVIGARTLQAALDRYPNADFLKMAHDIALSHHERFDGTGYPNALSGREIPLAGRIVALADVYDALTSDRVYRAAWSHAAAKEAIITGSGSQFDPDVVEAFLAVEMQVIHAKEHLSMPSSDPRAGVHNGHSAATSCFCQQNVGLHFSEM